MSLVRIFEYIDNNPSKLKKKKKKKKKKKSICNLVKK